ncbi:transcription factor HES-2-like [Channa argus]|uniref:transcription factor HES-2-like n=1 Tax=Channa argus TaxID=215402 RepID=UPI00294862AF|nr:hypothetical protein Q8A73_007550 [Channa argus]
MKMLHEMDDMTKDRKRIKSQVEKRRRERINRSLEHLRTMLLPEPQEMGGGQHRVEKAEILEHTVLFLQNMAKGDKTKAGGSSQKHSFQGGFSTCLHRAAQFLGPESKGLWLGAALDASFAARFASADSTATGVQKGTEACSSPESLQHTKSILRMLRQKCKRRLQRTGSGLSSSVHPYPTPLQQGCAKVPQEPQRQNELDIRAEGQTCKQSPSESHPISQALWRPWP